MKGLLSTYHSVKNILAKGKEAEVCGWQGQLVSPFQILPSLAIQFMLNVNFVKRCLQMAPVITTMSQFDRFLRPVTTPLILFAQT